MYGEYGPSWNPTGPVIPVKAEVKLIAPERYEVDQIGGCLGVTSRWPYDASYELKLDALDLGTGEMERLDFRCVQRMAQESTMDYYGIGRWAKTPMNTGDISYLRDLRNRINKILGDTK